MTRVLISLLCAFLLAIPSVVAQGFPQPQAPNQFGFAVVPSSGGGGLPSPVSVPNGGTGLSSIGPKGHILVSNGTTYDSVIGPYNIAIKRATSAELGALTTTPIPVVPAPGANKILIPFSMESYVDTGTAYVNSGFGYNLSYTSASGITINFNEACTGTADAFVCAAFAAPTSGFSYAAAIDKGLEITYTGSTSPTGGTADVIFIVRYSIEDAL